jgi:hypothetical protein
MGSPRPRCPLLARLCLQNGGRLSSGKRRLFETVTDDELAGAQEVVRQAMAPEQA